MALLNKYEIKNFVVLIMLIALPLPIRAADDKLQHFEISAICGAGAETYLHNNAELKTPTRILLSTALGTIPGLAKEIIDNNQDNNSFSRSDMKANIAGAFAGALLSCIINKSIQISIGTEKEKRVSVALIHKF